LEYVMHMIQISTLRLDVYLYNPKQRNAKNIIYFSAIIILETGPAWLI
jgi:hypothetical protein